MTWMRQCPDCYEYFDSYAKSNKAKCEECKLENRKNATIKLREFHEKRNGSTQKRQE